MENYSLPGGIKIHALKTKQFKHFSLGIYIIRPLCKQEAAKNALLTQVLKSGCKAFPSKQEIAAHLEWLYGASMHTGVQKKGEAQILTFHFSGILDSYTENCMVSSELASFAKEIIFSPLVIRDAFDEKIFEVEKADLRNEILALQNDKRDYANQRCLEIMCCTEPFGIHEYGSVDELDKITCQDLYNHYQAIIHNSEIHIFIMGDLDIEPIVNLYEDVQASGEMPKTLPGKMPEKVKNQREAMEVAQGKLVLGLRSNLPDSPENFCAMQLFNSIYGSGTHSKLFNNVREKLSLAYYAYSRFVRQKNILLVATGIEFQNFERAKSEILLQLNEMKQGNISQKEMDAAKEFLKNGYLSCYDEPVMMEDYYLGQILAGYMQWSIDDMVAGIQNVTRQQVIQAANSVKLDTVYFICGKDGNQ